MGILDKLLGKKGKESSSTRQSEDKQEGSETFACFDFPAITDNEIVGHYDQTGSGPYTRTMPIYILDWRVFLRDRPGDIPFYTSVNGEPCIAIHLTGSTVQDPRLVDRAIDNKWSHGLFCKTFTFGGYPLIRTNFCFVDVPDDPLIMETALNITQEDVQNFFNATQKADSLYVIINHSVNPDKVHQLRCVIPPALKELQKREVEKAIESYNQGLRSLEFKEAVAEMERMFPSANFGVSTTDFIDLELIESSRL